MLLQPLDHNHHCLVNNSFDVVWWILYRDPCGCDSGSLAGELSSLLRDFKECTEYSPSVLDFPTLLPVNWNGASSILKGTKGVAETPRQWLSKNGPVDGCKAGCPHAFVVDMGKKQSVQQLVSGSGAIVCWWRFLGWWHYYVVGLDFVKEAHATHPWVRRWPIAATVVTNHFCWNFWMCLFCAVSCVKQKVLMSSC